MQKIPKPHHRYYRNVTKMLTTGGDCYNKRKKPNMKRPFHFSHASRLLFVRAQLFMLSLKEIEETSAQERKKKEKVVKIRKQVQP